MSNTTREERARAMVDAALHIRSCSYMGHCLPTILWQVPGGAENFIENPGELPTAVVQLMLAFSDQELAERDKERQVAGLFLGEYQKEIVERTAEVEQLKAQL